MQNRGSHNGSTAEKLNLKSFGRFFGRVLLLTALGIAVGPHGLWAQIAAPATPVLSFNSAEVGISEATAQELTATFTVSGYSGTFTPTASLHYSYDYLAGTVNCTGGASPETCTVTITFIPTLPGPRKDALFLMNGSTIMSTVYLGGTGQAPMALVQPGVVTSPLTSFSTYIYEGTVDENGTVYFVATEGPAIYSFPKSGGTPTKLVSTSNVPTLTTPDSITIDGAGTLYYTENTYSHDVFTYNPNSGPGSIAMTPPSNVYTPCSNTNSGNLEYLNSVAFDDIGNLYSLEILCDVVFTLDVSGNFSVTDVLPTMTQPSQVAVDANGDIFVGGYAIDEFNPGPMTNPINTGGSTDGLAVDAAGTVYAGRYTGETGVVLLPASNYATPLAQLDPSASPLGFGLGSDGTLYVGNYTSLDKVDRSQGAINFGEQFAGTTSTAMNVGIYNGGNESLTISNISLPGTIFAEQATATNGCSNGTMLAPGAQCQVAVTMTAPHGGTYTGTLTFTTDTLNTSATETNVALSGYVLGPYVTSSPTALSFPNQEINTTSGALTVTLTNNGYYYNANIGIPSSVAGFTISHNGCTSSVAPGSNCQIGYTFSPTSAMEYSGTVTVSISSSGGGSPPSASFMISGMGIEPVGSLSQSSLSFANQDEYTTSPAQQVTLSNTGLGTLTIASIVPSANFGESDNCMGSVAAGSHCTINVTFAPLALGPLTGTVTITDNTLGVTGTLQRIDLGGTGTAPVVSLSPTTLSFGPQGVATSSSKTVTLSNTGNGPLYISGLTTSGYFSQTNTCGSILNAGNSCPIVVTFKPLGLGTFIGTLTLSDNATGSPQTVPLSGAGVNFTAGPNPPVVEPPPANPIPIVTGGPGSPVGVGPRRPVKSPLTPLGPHPGAATTANAFEAKISSSLLVFSPQIVGTSSGAQSVILSNAGDAPLPITGIAVSGDFAQTNDCGKSLEAGEHCTISVTFIPAMAGGSSGKLTISHKDGSAGSSQTVSLNGTGADPAARALDRPTASPHP